MEELKSSLPKPDKEAVDYSKLITVDYALAKYNVSRSLIYDKFSRKRIRAKRIGFASYVPMNVLDAIFASGEKLGESVWAPVPAIIKKYGITIKYINDFSRKYIVPEKRVGTIPYFSIADGKQLVSLKVKTMNF